jgi:hypothetical protein
MAAPDHLAEMHVKRINKINRIGSHPFSLSLIEFTISYIFGE